MKLFATISNISRVLTLPKILSKAKAHIEHSQLMAFSLFVPIWHRVVCCLSLNLSIHDFIFHSAKYIYFQYYKVEKKFIIPFSKPET